MDTLRWYKSTRSNGSGACVEVAHRESGQTFIRDTKDREGGTLSVSAAGWRSFVSSVGADRLH